LVAIRFHILFKIIRLKSFHGRSKRENQAKQQLKAKAKRKKKNKGRIKETKEKQRRNKRKTKKGMLSK